MAGVCRGQPTIETDYQAETIQLGQTATLSFLVYGTAPFTYQWYYGTTALANGANSDGSAYAGATTNVLTITGPTAAEAGNYSLAVTDANGISATSQPIALNVAAPAGPTISNQPLDTTVVAGSAASFSVNVIGSYPLTYLWYSGTPPNGQAIPNSNANPFTLPVVTAADAGPYYVVVSNAYGPSATSQAATLTVTPATAPTIGYYSGTQTLAVGDSLVLEAYPEGSFPLTVQWSLNGTPIPGATQYTYSVAAVTAANAGTYTLTATNIAGSVTSPAIVVNVNPPTAPAFTEQPQSQTVAYGGSLYLYTQASDPSPQYQWYLNGTAIQGATSSFYSLFEPSPQASGAYTVVASNSGGTATSATANVTVQGPVSPDISEQPASLSTPAGSSASFYVWVSNPYNVTYQWYDNGTPIAGATQSSFEISSVAASNAGSYTVQLTNPAGTVTSQAAVLTVLPPVPPAFVGYFGPIETSATVGQSTSLTAPALGYGSQGPYTYQWYQNGSAIPNSDTSTLNLGSAQPSSSGTYVVTVTNAGGSVSAVFELEVNPPANTGTPWLDARQQGSVAYFLYASHLERYDLTNSVWLPNTTFSQTATAFCTDASGIYVAFGRAIVQYSLDLSTSSTVANVPESISGLVYAAGYLFTGGSSNYAIDVSTGAQIDGNELGSVSLYLPGAGKIFSLTDWDYSSFSVGADGALTTDALTTYYGTFPLATRLYAFPDGARLANNGGTIFNGANDAVLGSFGGAFTDMTFLADGTPVVLRGHWLYEYGGAVPVETGHLVLPVYGNAVFAQGQSAVVFYPGSSTGSSDIGLSAFPVANFASSYTAAPPVSPQNLQFTPAAATVDENGVVYLLDADGENVLRWSSSSQSYLTSIGLLGVPQALTYSATSHTLFGVYTEGNLTAIDTTSAVPAESFVPPIPDETVAVVAAGDNLFAVVQDAEDTGEHIITQNSAGQTTSVVGFSYFDNGWTWSDANQEVYGFDVDGLLAATVNAAGYTVQSRIGTGLDYQSATLVSVSPDGARVALNDGEIFTGNLTVPLGVLANPVMDVAWLGDNPVTLHAVANGAEVQLWSAGNNGLLVSCEVAGTPLHIFGVPNNQFVVLTEYNGAPAFTILDQNLTVLSTTTQPATTGAPVFLTQPAATITAAGGAGLTLAVSTAGATPQTFQWYEGTTPVPGATGPTLSFSSLSAANAGNYSVVATNTAGSATSRTISLSVGNVPQFATQPQSQTVAFGTSVELTATLEGSPVVSYQWYVDGRPISGATSNVLNLGPIYDTQNASGDSYVLVATNSAGTAYSAPALIAVGNSVSAPQITAQPSSVVAASGASASFSVTALGASLSYQWSFDGSPIGGATASSYTIASVSAANVGSYTVAVTNSGGSVTSQSASLALSSTSNGGGGNGGSGSGPTGPSFTVSIPPSISAVLNSGENINASVSPSTGSYTYQWFRNGQALPFGSNATLSLEPITADSAGSYTVEVTSGDTTVTSNPLTLSVIQSFAGEYFGTFSGGGNWAMSIGLANTGSYCAFLPNGGGTLVYSVTVNPDGSFAASPPDTSGTDDAAGHPDVALPGELTGQIANAAVSGQLAGVGLTESGAQDTGAGNDLAGIYTLPALNGASGTVYLIVGPSGETNVFDTGSGTGAFASGSVDDSGTFTAASTTAAGISVAIDPENLLASVTISPSGGGAPASFSGLSQIESNTAHLVNLSARGQVDASGNLLIAGFVIDGSSAKNILARGVGPTLTQFAVTDALSTPQLALYPQGQPAMWTGEAWGGSSALAGVFSQVGAFSLPAGSADAAVLQQLGSGAYTAVVSTTGSGNSGIALVELYDADVGTPTAHLINLSARALVGNGQGALAAGLVIAGTGPETVLLRGIGPGLSSFGVADALPATELTLYDKFGNTISSTSGWNASLAAVFSQVGAFALTAGSADSALEVTLTPGIYTVQVSGQNGATGTAMVEIYEVK